MKWIVTSFEPFGGADTNSSALVLERLRKEFPSDEFQFFPGMPVCFERSWSWLESKLNEEKRLKGVVALGQAEGRRRISLERVALNCIDARIADNSGNQPKLIKVRDGEDVLWTNIRWERLEDSPHWERSYSAGTFVCNALMYHLLHWCRPRGIYGGFIHIPKLSSQTHPSLKEAPAMDENIALFSMRRILKFLRTL